MDLKFNSLCIYSKYIIILQKLTYFQFRVTYKYINICIWCMPFLCYIVSPFIKNNILVSIDESQKKSNNNNNE